MRATDSGRLLSFINFTLSSGDGIERTSTITPSSPLSSFIELLHKVLYIFASFTLTLTDEVRGNAVENNEEEFCIIHATTRNPYFVNRDDNCFGTILKAFQTPTMKNQNRFTQYLAVGTLTENVFVKKNTQIRQLFMINKYECN